MTLGQEHTVSQLRFHHVQLYADSIKPLSYYKAIEDKLTQFASLSKFNCSRDMLQGDALTSQITTGSAVWSGMVGKEGASVGEESRTPFQSAGRDVVEQLMYGLGFRIVASRDDDETRSMLLTSCDQRGAKFLVTARKESRAAKAGKAAVASGPFPHLSAAAVRRFYDSHAGRPGFAVMSFEVEAGGVEKIYQRYRVRS